MIVTARAWSRLHAPSPWPPLRAGDKWCSSTRHQGRSPHTKRPCSPQHPNEAPTLPVTRRRCLAHSFAGAGSFSLTITVHCSHKVTSWRLLSGSASCLTWSPSSGSRWPWGWCGRWGADTRKTANVYRAIVVNGECCSVFGGPLWLIDRRAFSLLYNRKFKQLKMEK